MTSAPATRVVLRVDPATRRATGLASGLVIGVLSGLILLGEVGVLGRRPDAFTLAYSLLIIGLMAYGLIGFQRGRVVLEPDAVTVTRGMGAPQRIARSEIVGRRMHAGGWRRQHYHILELRDGKSVKFPPWVEDHAPLRTFLAGIPLHR